MARSVRAEMAKLIDVAPDPSGLDKALHPARYTKTQSPKNGHGGKKAR